MKIYWVKANILELTLLLNSSAFWITSLSVIEVDSSMLTNSIGSLKMVLNCYLYKNLCSFIFMFWLYSKIVYGFPLRFSLSWVFKNTVSWVWVYSLFRTCFSLPTVVMETILLLWWINFGYQLFWNIESLFTIGFL